MNQAFFHKVWVTEDGVVGWDYNRPFASLMEAHGAAVTKLPPAAEALTPTSAEKPTQAHQRIISNFQAYQRKRPDRTVGALIAVSGSRQEHLAERVGFEPTDGVTRHLLSREARSAGLRHLSRLNDDSPN